jgi:hypothetical protein
MGRGVAADDQTDMTMTLDCAACGSARRAEDRFCAHCGQALLTTPPGVLASNVAPGALRGPTTIDVAARASGSGERAWTHPGLAFALVCLTLGLYTFWWVFDSWQELKRQDGDEGKRPFWHTLSLVVPVYGLFRLHDHMRTIARLVRTSGGDTSLSAGTAVVLWVIVNMLMRASGAPGQWWIYVLALLVNGGMVAWAQAALNRACYLQDPQARVRPTHPGKWVALGIGAIVSLLALVGLAT